LNKYPKLRDVLRNQVGVYEDLKVEWVPGAAPKAYLYDADRTVVRELEVGDKNLQEVLQLLKDNGFVPSLKKIVMGAPLQTVSFGGHHYEVFNVPNFFEAAVAFASSRSHGGEAGYLVTITSNLEAQFISKVMQDNKLQTAWLGAQDDENEGTWKWLGGAEKGSPFWEGKTDGHKVDEMFTNWRTGEPNDVQNEDCAVMMSDDGGWNDAKCDTETYSVIVEFGSGPLQVTDSEKAQLQQKPEEGHVDL